MVVDEVRDRERRNGALHIGIPDERVQRVKDVVEAGVRSNRRKLLPEVEDAALLPDHVCDAVVEHPGLRGDEGVFIAERQEPEGAARGLIGWRDNERGIRLLEEVQPPHAPDAVAEVGGRQHRALSNDAERAAVGHGEQGIVWPGAVVVEAKGCLVGVRHGNERGDAVDDGDAVQPLGK